MKNLWCLIQFALASVGSFAVWFLGGIDGYIYVLIVFVAADYITGVMRAAVMRSLSSKIGAKGILRKILIFILIGLSNLVDYYLLINSGVLRAAVVFFYISNEGISILENVHAMGLPVPAKLKVVMRRLEGDKSGRKTKRG